MITRRALVSAFAAFAFTSHAATPDKPARLRRIGFLGPGSASGYLRETEAIRAGLRGLGYVEGRSIAIEYRWAEGNLDRLRAMGSR